MVYIVKKMEKGVQPYQFDGEFDPKKPFMPYEALNEAEIEAADPAQTAEEAENEAVE